MKYKTFRSLAVVGAVSAAGLGAWSLWPDARNASSSSSANPSQVSLPASTTPGLSELEQAMAEALTLPVQDKIKDASEGHGFKINLYSDDGQRFNRAKVDLDRDEHWDEKWTFKPDGTTERQVAPADDDQYTKTYVKQGATWREL